MRASVNKTNKFSGHSDITGKPYNLSNKIKLLLAKTNITYVIETPEYVVVRAFANSVHLYGNEFGELIGEGLIGFGVSADSDNIFELYFSTLNKKNN